MENFENMIDAKLSVSKQREGKGAKSRSFVNGMMSSIKKENHKHIITETATNHTVNIISGRFKRSQNSTCAVLPEAKADNSGSWANTNALDKSPRRLSVSKRSCYTETPTDFRVSPTISSHTMNKHDRSIDINLSESGTKKLEHKFEMNSNIYSDSECSISTLSDPTIQRRFEQNREHL